VRTPTRLVPFALVLAAAPAAAWDDCAHRVPRNLDLSADGVTTLAVRAKAGSLSIRGAGAGSAIAVRGEACASEESELAEIRIVESRQGSTLVLTVEMPETEAWSWGDNYRTLDLDLTVPARLALEVQDSSGEAEIRGVASLTIQDSSGELEIQSIAGDVEIRDSSGEIDVRDVGGDLNIPADSSGEITARHVRGNAEIDHDSSGSITLSDIGGDAIVGTDSSGDIEFDRITGSARVGKDSSGSIEARDVGRDFVVRSDGSGGISHHGVRGLVDVPEE